ncbi:MAG: hypothetical protein IT330_16640 [Anaerolineae bacterium]|nr:hypothetical protein [Anaerolineae bacterium]
MEPSAAVRLACLASCAASRSPRLHLVGAVYAQPYSAGQADRLAVTAVHRSCRENRQHAGRSPWRARQGTAQGARRQGTAQGRKRHLVGAVYAQPYSAMGSPHP